MGVYLKGAMNLGYNGKKEQGKIMLHVRLKVDGNGRARQRRKYAEG